MKYLIGLIVVVLIAGGGYYYYTTMNVPEVSPMTGGEPAVEGGDLMEGGMNMEIMEPSGIGGMEEIDGVKVFTIEAGNFFFSPNTMTVKKGDTVRVVLKNTGGFHDFVLDEFGVKTAQANGPTEETVEFVADKAGTFEYYCSVGQHRQNGMVGTLTVTE